MVKTAIASGDRSNIPEVVGSNPTPATKKLSRQDDFHSRPACLFLPPDLDMPLVKYRYVVVLSFTLC